MPPPDARWRLCTPPDRPGAIAVLQITGDVDRAFDALGVPPLPSGDVRVRDIAGVDRGLVARLRDDLLLLMPHGGTELVRQLCAALTRAGLARDDSSLLAGRFPEAQTEFDAALLDTLARAVSPRAVDLLLEQPARWATHGMPSPPLDTPSPAPEVSRRLDRLVVPPLVVAIGPSNVGKSTLLNRLAGRPVVITADEPGTTRDHVGSLIDLDGLIVRYVDTPGVRPDATGHERAALEIVRPLLAAADLVLCLGDRDRPAPPAPPGRESFAVAIRADLGRARWPHDAAVSAATGEGLAELTVLLRRRLVPDEALASDRPWRFWSGIAPDESLKCAPGETRPSPR
ncbi:MAG: GTPase [Phycisphaerales bacterium JB041]